MANNDHLGRPIDAPLLAGLSAKALGDDNEPQSTPCPFLQKPSAATLKQRWVLENIYGPASEFAGAEPTSTSGKYYAFLSAIQNGTATLQMCEALAADQDPFVRATVAANHVTPRELLASLVSDSNAEVLERLAENPSTPDETLAALAAKGSVKIAISIASNQSAPPEVLTELARNQNEEIRAAVAAASSTPRSVLAKLAKDKDWGVRRGAAWNEALPEDLRKQLLQDPIYLVRESALFRATDEQVAKAASEDKEVRAKAEHIQAWRSTTHPEVLAKLARGRRLSVLSLVSENENTPPAVLEQLAKNPQCASAVAENHSTPPAVLEQLATHPQFAFHVAKNIASPESLLRRIIAEHPTSDAEQTLARKRAEDNGTSSLQIAEAPSRDIGADALNVSMIVSVLTDQPITSRKQA